MGELGDPVYFFLGILADYEDVITERVVIILCLGSLFWFLSFFLLLGYPGNLGLWNDPSKFINAEFVQGHTNVIDYGDQDFLALLGINQFLEKISK